MKFSEQWLRTWTNPAIDSAQLAQQLTMAGLEVETITPAAAEFSNVVVGEVITAQPHPNADRLRVCQVNVGEETLNIVCGAKNVRAGLKVAVAVVGAVLPGGFNIKKAKLRGVESCGMICSAAELGLGKNADGIMELPADAPPGKNFREYYELNDQIFEMGITPNRGDCLSIAGIARDVSAITKCEIKEPVIENIRVEIDAAFPLQVNTAKACPQYMGIIIRGVNPQAQTPVWMQERLRRSDMKIISPIVDVTNYVMLEMGQPLHAFDLAKLQTGIQVRLAKPKEELILLDGQQLILDENTLVIADANKAQALAGVMGGLDSGVTAATTDIFLESAFFDPIIVTTCAKRYGLHTDSSHRFERGVDPQLQLKALQRAVALLLDIVGGQAGSLNSVIYKKHLPKQQIIKLRRERIQRILGVAISDNNVIGILQRLAMKVEAVADGWQVIVPSFRFDIMQEIDLIEELARIYSYDKIPEHKLTAQLTISAAADKTNLRRVLSLLVDRGYHEAINYSFVDSKLQELLDPEHKPIALQNPISQDLAVMRTNLWSGLIKNVLYNQHRQQQRIRLFETGLCFVKQNKVLQQYPVLAGVAVGSRYPQQWGEAQQNSDFFDVKGDLQALLQLTGYQQNIRFIAAKHAALHPVRAAQIYCADKPIGYLGELHPTIKQKLKIIDSAYLFELNLSALSNVLPSKFRDIPKFPAMARDIALVVDEQISAQQIIDTIFANGGDLLRNVRIFDVYQGESIAEGKKSIALNLILQYASRTLIDSEVDRVVQQILQALKQKFNITLRS